MRGQDKAEAYYHLLESVADEYEVEYNSAPGPKWQAINGISSNARLERHRDGGRRLFN